jgi:hypothetical protein
MDPRIRIPIHTKMSWIRNTAQTRNNFLQATAARDTAASSPQPPTTAARVLRTTALPLLLLLLM